VKTSECGLRASARDFRGGYAFRSNRIWENVSAFQNITCRM